MVLLRATICLCAVLGSELRSDSRSLTGEVLLAESGENGSEFARFHGECDKRYPSRADLLVESLYAGMPLIDRQTLSSELLVNNLNFAMKARTNFPWSEQVSEEMFLNDVLPYAILDETREDWRPSFYGICSKIVKNCQTASEAAQELNRVLFDELNVHYNRGRKKPNQSPSESVATGKATCTGLSIILAYGCRSVGIPARLVGTPLWSDKSGNHTWVEIWDGEWKFLGADEFDKKGLNRAWFAGRASKAQADKWQHAIWATSWKKENAHFPMVWARGNKSVGAVNVTSRYTKTKKAEAIGLKQLAVRVFDQTGGKRVVAEVGLLDEEGKLSKIVKTKAGRADMNDVARLSLTGEAPWTLQVTAKDVTQNVVVNELPEQPVDVILQKRAKKKFDLLAVMEAWKKEGREQREEELEKKVITIGDKKLRFLEKKFGEEPEEGHALWISMHGGGGAPPRVNDRQWKNQIGLYQPKEGYYVAPRAPTDTWNLWHQPHIDVLFDRMIANYVICRGVDPNRIYLMGYSAGGDGVYKLAPRMADRFAAAAMMAGHPNGTNPEGLRNLPFEIFMGGEDGAYKRNQIAAKWKDLLANLKEEDPTGYPHRVTIYPGLGHWMNGKDAEVIPRMIQLSRQEWPKKVVWIQDGVTHERFYWLGVSKEGAKAKRKLVGEVEGQTISVTGEDVTGLKLWLSDELLNLDEEVVVEVNGKEAFRGKVERREEVTAQSLRQRSGMIATALLEL